MAPSAERSQPPTAFEYTTQIDARRAEFVLLASVDYLDLDKLAGAAHAEIELGYFKTCSSCRHSVRAIVKEGMVTDLLMEPCSTEETEPASPEFVCLLSIARDHVAPPEGELFRPPMPVADFMPNAARMSIRTMVCIEVCVFNVCRYCCSVAGGDWICGKSVLIDTTP